MLFMFLLQMVECQTHTYSRYGSIINLVYCIPPNMGRPRGGEEIKFIHKWKLTVLISVLSFFTQQNCLGFDPHKPYRLSYNVSITHCTVFMVITVIVSMCMSMI